MGRLIYLLIIFAITLSFLSCSAPHDNPLDPDNPDNSLYYIDGTVYSSEASSKPLAGVSVLWKPLNLSVYTNNDGYFKIYCDSLKDGWLVFSKNGFINDSLEILWNNKKTKNIFKAMNSLPVLDSISTYSSIKNKYSLPEKQIIIEAYASDKDNDIDTLFVVNTALGISKPLEKITSKYFEGRFSDYDLVLNSIEQLIGKRLEIYASSGGRTTLIGGSFIRRVISDQIETLSPVNSDTIVTSTPELSWKRFDPGFEFSYSIEIYTDEPEPKLLLKKDGISSDDISFKVSSNIAFTADNKFFWVIWAIDEYKDRTRSKPAGFTIKR